MQREGRGLTPSLYPIGVMLCGFEPTAAVGKALTTACGGNFVSAFLNRNKRSAQWAVAPIEVAGFESRRDHESLLDIVASFFTFALYIVLSNKLAVEMKVDLLLKFDGITRTFSRHGNMSDNSSSNQLDCC